MNIFERAKNYFKKDSGQIAEATIDSEDNLYTRLTGKESKGLPDNYLEEIREQSWAAFVTNPIGKRQVKTLTSYLVGRGLSVSSLSKDAQRAIDRFVNEKENYWDMFVREESNRIQIDGEAFVILFINRYDGTVIARDVEPNEVKEIFTDPDDYKKIIGIKRAYTRRIPHEDFSGYRFEYIEEVIQPGLPDPRNRNIIRDFVYVKIPTVATMQRGIPDLASHLYWLKQFRGILDARVALNKFRAAYIWDVTIQGTPADVEDFRNKNSRPPKPGTIKIHNQSVTWEAKSPNIAAADAKDDIRSVKLMAVAGSGLPEHILTGDASNSNYSSTEQATLPFIKGVEDYQDLFEFFFKDLFGKVIYYGQRYGDIPKRLTDENGKEIDGDNLIVTTFPEIQPKDEAKQAQAIQVYDTLGLASKETLSTKAGFKWEHEKKKMEEEEAEYRDKYPEYRPDEEEEEQWPDSRKK